MEILKSFVKKIKENTNDGFSLLELVVAVGILLVLTVSGLISYNQIMTNARNARVNNIAADLYMLGSTHRSAGDDTTADTKDLQDWASANKMTFEKIPDISGCDNYKNSVKDEGLTVEYSVDKNGLVKVYVENTYNHYKVDKQEPGFDIYCGN